MELEAQVKILKHKIDVHEQQLDIKTQYISELENRIAEYQNELAIAATKLHEGETMRRKLHNMVQELKGNIRVFCRIRPFLNGENDSKDESGLPEHIRIGVNEDNLEEIRIIQSSESASGSAISKPFPFTFDKVLHLQFAE